MCGTATEPIGEVRRLGALLAPPQQPALDRSEPLALWGSAPGKTREDEDLLDVAGAAFEASTDLAGSNPGVRELTDTTFERSKMMEIIHQFARYRLARSRRRVGQPSRLVTPECGGSSSRHGVKLGDVQALALRPSFQ